MFLCCIYLPRLCSQKMFLCSISLPRLCSPYIPHVCVPYIFLPRLCSLDIPTTSVCPVYSYHVCVPWISLPRLCSLYIPATSVFPAGDVTLFYTPTTSAFPVIVPMPYIPATFVNSVPNKGCSVVYSYHVCVSCCVACKWSDGIYTYRVSVPCN